MNVIPLIGAHLKSDDIIDFREHWEAVVFSTSIDYMRTRQMHIVSQSPLLEWNFFFDANQILKTLFLQVAATDEIAPFDIANSDVAFWKSTDEARQFAASQRLTATEGSALFLGVLRDWIKLNHGAHTSHYEFVGRKLNTVTLAIPMG